MINLKTLIIQSEQLAHEIAQLEAAVNDAPPGKLVSRRRNGSFEYSYRIRDNTGKEREIYIPKSDIEYARQLAFRDYAKVRLIEAREEKQIMDSWIDFIRSERSADKYLIDHPGAGNLVLDQLTSPDEAIQKWQNADYRKSNRYMEYLKYTTVVPGLLVRSKSEADIISRMVYYGVPFRYEEEVIVNDIAFHPDITGLNCRTRQIKYWEHQGAWDKENYVKPLKDREVQLARAGIIPWKNLIITTETADEPLDITWVDTIIQHFFL